MLLKRSRLLIAATILCVKLYITSGIWMQASAPVGPLQSSAVINVHGGPLLRILLMANVVELEVRLSNDTLDFGCVRAGCCKVRNTLPD